MAIFKTKKKMALPKLTMLKTDSLTIDKTYQRKIDLKHVKEIEDKFDPDLFGIIVVSERDGKYYVVDGQHRWLAVKDYFDELPCLLWQGLSYIEECKKFKKLNFLRKALNSNIIFHNMVCSQEENALAVVHIMEKHGFSYNRDNQLAKDNVIGSTKRMLEIYTRYGENALDRLLYIIRRSWHGTKSGLSATVLVGINTFLIENPKAKDEYIIKTLEKLEPSMLKVQASYYITADNINGLSGGSSRFVHIANAIKAAYNKVAPRSERIL